MLNTNMLISIASVIYSLKSIKTGKMIGLQFADDTTLSFTAECQNILETQPFTHLNSCT